MHGITPQRVAKAAVFGQLLTRLTQMLHGRAVVAYTAGFDRGVFERELRCHLGDPRAAQEWLGRIRWHDAMVPYVAWRGLWSAKLGTYRNQPLGGPHGAVADCRRLLILLEAVARSVAAAPRDFPAATGPGAVTPCSRPSFTPRDSVRTSRPTAPHLGISGC